MAVDAVDAAAQQVRADVKREAALEPDRRGLLAAEAVVVALERGDRLAVQLHFLVRVAEAEASPAVLEQCHQLWQAGRSGLDAGDRLLVGELGVEALQHLVEEDPEPLLERLLTRNGEHARE